MLEKFGQALKNTMNKIAGAIFLDKKAIDEICVELKRALLEADVSTEITSQIIEKIKKKASENVSGLEKREQLIKFIHDEMTGIVGKEAKEIKIDKKARPFKIMLVGLYAAGKTTAASKLGFYYSKRGFKTCLIGLDVHRPAAPEQLEQMAEKAKVSSFVDKQEKNAMAIWEKFSNKIKQFDLAIVDTAGRDVLNGDLIDEITLLYEEIKPNLVILVMPADIGKAAADQARGFKKACKIDGILITRMDGTARGGGALVSCNETNSNVLFIGTGEKIQDLETFDPSGFVSRLLGMGDLKGLLEKASTIIDEKDQEKLKSRMNEGKFTLSDLYDQIKNMQKMGPLDKIADMIPGLGGIKSKLPDIFNIQEEKMKRWKFAIDSMTPEERENPEVINSSRTARVSRGSNVPTNEIRELIKQHKLVKDFVSSSSAGGMGMGEMGAGGMQGMDKKMMEKLARKFGRRMF
jgi:signal recognition particle subunit SRP54